AGTAAEKCHVVVAMEYQRGVAATQGDDVAAGAGIDGLSCPRGDGGSYPRGIDDQVSTKVAIRLRKVGNTAVTACHRSSGWQPHAGNRKARGVLPRGNLVLEGEHAGAGAGDVCGPAAVIQQQLRSP